MAALLPASRAHAGAADTARRLRAEGDIQTRFAEAPAPPEPPAWTQWLGDMFGWLAGDGNLYVKALAAVLVAALAIAILYMAAPVVRDTIDGWLGRKRDGAREDEDAWRPDDAAARDLLAEADALAAAGRYDDAAHLLLGRSLEDIASRRPGLLRPALTARAIAGLDGLPLAARDAFAAIANAVERSRWALRPLAQDDWTQAREAYRLFAFGAHWRGAAR